MAGDHQQRVNNVKMQHFISLTDTTCQQLQSIMEISLELRDQRQAGQRHEQILAGKSLAMIFEKASLRTRVSFEQAIIELGGHATVLGDAEVGLGRRESAADVVRVLTGMVHGVIARVFEHQKLIDLAEYGSVPVINALSDHSHPVQALADAMTLMDEFGRDLTGRTLAFVGDGNNVARSLATLCGMLNMNFVLACPQGYELASAFIDDLCRRVPSLQYRLTHDATEAVQQADAVYTDTWASMGQEAQLDDRQKMFADYQVNAALLESAPPHAIVLHCLPAHRGQEITDEVFEGAQSRIFPQAHNRLHTQKGLLAVLYGRHR